MENKMEIYNKYREVPKDAQKPFDNGKFKGTDINTMWRIKCLTEAFGPCGIGWFYEIKRLWIDETKNGEQFAFAEIALRIKVDGEWSMPISGTGGNKMTRVTKSGEYSTSDEAYKMAITDALGVACKNLGFGADIYWANDKTKYTDANDKNLDEIESSLNPVLVEQAKELGIDFIKFAAYKKVAVSEITDEMLEEGIKKKLEARKK